MDREIGPKGPKRLDAGKLFDYALRALGARSLSTAEMRRKLAERAEKEDDVAAVLARLKENGFLDDRRFAEGFTAARLENEGFGRARTLRDLGRRRIAPRIAQEAVNEAYGETDETALIENYLARKFRGISLGEYLAEPRHLAAAYRRLRTAGFSAPNVVAVLRRYAGNADDLDGMEEDSGAG